MSGWYPIGRTLLESGSLPIVMGTLVALPVNHNTCLGEYGVKGYGWSKGIKEKMGVKP